MAYSVLKAITGSFLAAIPEGINPASKVKKVESKIRPIEYNGDNSVKSATSIKFKITT